jgi:hypothetical protein
MREFPTTAPEVVLAALHNRKDGDFFHTLTLPMRQIGPNSVSKEYSNYLSYLSIYSLSIE